MFMRISTSVELEDGPGDGSQEVKENGYPPLIPLIRHIFEDDVPFSWRVGSMMYFTEIPTYFHGGFIGVK